MAGKEALMILFVWICLMLVFIGGIGIVLFEDYSPVMSDIALAMVCIGGIVLVGMAFWLALSTYS